MSSIRHFVTRRTHRKDCIAMAAVLRGDWNSPWVLSDESEWSDVRGGKRGRTVHWHVAVCNDPICPARILVNSEWLTKLVYEHSKRKATDLSSEHQTAKPRASKEGQ